MDIRTISTDGITMKYFRFGNTQGQPFVIIPGVAVKSVMLSYEMIVRQYGTIAESCDVYVIDRREDMPDRYNVYDMAPHMSKKNLLRYHNAPVYTRDEIFDAIEHPESHCARHITVEGSLIEGETVRGLSR